MAEITQRLTGLVAACLLLAACASTSSPQSGTAPATAAPESTTTGHASTQLYPATEPYPATYARLQQARQQAIADNKLLMLVLGADWCHDSRGLVNRFQDPGFATLLDNRYQVLLINVGYLDHIRGIVNRYDVPVIYGTPTVMIVEPETNSLLNRDSLPYWRDADSISIDATIDYFNAYKPGQTLPVAQPASAALAQALADIDRFELQQAERIYEAFAELGVIMRNMNPARPSQEFLQKWKNLGQMRSSITVDLISLRREARAQDAAGADPIKLTYPHYALFIDDASTAAQGPEEASPKL